MRHQPFFQQRYVGRIVGSIFLEERVKVVLRGKFKNFGQTNNNFKIEFYKNFFVVILRLLVTTMLVSDTLKSLFRQLLRNFQRLSYFEVVAG